MEVAGSQYTAYFLGICRVQSQGHGIGCRILFSLYWFFFPDTHPVLGMERYIFLDIPK